MLSILDKPTSGEKFGTGFGSGLGQALNQFVMDRVNQLKIRSGLKAIGMPSKSVSGVAQLPPHIMQEVIKNYLASPLGEGLNEKLEKLKQDTPVDLGNLSFTNKFIGNQKSTGAPGTVSSDIDNMEALGASGNVDQGKIAENLARPNVPEPDLKSILNAPRLGAHEQIAIAKILQKKQSDAAKLGQRAQIEVNKQRNIQEERNEKKAAPYLKEMEDSQLGLMEENMALDQMEAEMNEGNLPDGRVVQALDAMGIKNPAAFLQNPSGEVFTTAAKTFLKNLKRYFGANVSQKEMEQLLKSLPSLANTQEGKRKMIRYTKLINEAKNAEYNATQKVLESNNWKAPANLRVQSKRLAAQQVKKLSDKLFEGAKTDKIKLSLPTRNIEENQTITNDKTGKTYTFHNGEWFSV